ncbi:unnamed protein product, partial [Rotaria magnacalcarata]
IQIIVTNNKSIELLCGCLTTCLLGSTLATSWYNEISSYNYSSPDFSSSTGHFTQVIWKISIQLGIGIGLSSDSMTATVVGNYYPARNVIGSFSDNVLEICSSTIGGD